MPGVEQTKNAQNKNDSVKRHRIPPKIGLWFQQFRVGRRAESRLERAYTLKFFHIMSQSRKRQKGGDRKTANKKLSQPISAKAQKKKREKTGREKNQKQEKKFSGAKGRKKYRVPAATETSQGPRIGVQRWQRREQRRDRQVAS